MIRVTDPADAVAADILQLAREGKRLEAIRALRKASGLGLVAAARVVDAARRS